MIDLIGYMQPYVEGFVIESTSDKGIECIHNFLYRKQKTIIDKTCVVNIGGKDNE